MEKLKILLADDEEILREMIQKYFSRHGYEVIAFENGQKTWGFYQEKKSELSALLTDIEMPVMNGLELIENVRRDNPNFPIVAYTGNYDCIQKAKEKGANEVVEKPCMPPVLINLFDKLLGVKRE